MTLTRFHSFHPIRPSPNERGSHAIALESDNCPIVVGPLLVAKNVSFRLFDWDGAEAFARGWGPTLRAGLRRSGEWVFPRLS